MDRDERSYWVALSRVPGVGPVRFAMLVQHFGDAAHAWSATKLQLREAALDDKTADALIHARQDYKPLVELEHAEHAGVQVLTFQDPDYPPLLKEISAPPAVLYVKGELLTEDRLSIAVVGTREATSYGRLVAERLSGELASHGVTIVSGLARGIDAVAHRAALSAGGRTLAVLGSGVNVIYPNEHRGLAGTICTAGALISEYPPNAKPERDNFPARNRLISGMTMGTLVIEAGDVSGALITGKMALEQNREVFAVPGAITSERSRGTNALIRRGEAKLVSNVQDILEELNPKLVVEQLQMVELVPDNDTEAALLRVLTSEPLHIDDLARGTQLPVSAVSGALAILDLKGAVRDVGGMRYVRLR